MSERLRTLEETGNYVFHGSPVSNMQALEPRQGTHTPDESKQGEKILDGKPAVSATPFVSFAIFRAIVNNANVPFKHSSRFGFKDGEREYRVSSVEVLESVRGKKGYVYVFDKDEFEPYSRDGKVRDGLMEWRAYKKVKPVEVVEVTYEDLPLEEIVSTN